MKKAQIRGADARVAATGSDAINTVVAIPEHSLGVETIIAKLNDP